MKLLKTNQTIICENLQDARIKCAGTINGIIIVKNEYYSVVHPKVYLQLRSLGYTEVQ